MAASREASPAFRTSATRPGPIGLIREATAEIASRQRLIRYLVAADLKKKGADTLLGNLWWVLDPLLQMVVYVVLVSIIFSRTTPDYPLFIFAAILPWKWFTSAVQDAIVSVVSQGQLIRQVRFPKVILPVAATTAGVVNFAFGMIPLALIMLFYQDRISWTLALIPVIAAVQFVFTLGVALFVAAANVFFRDLGNIARHLLRLWFYLSPGLYSLTLLDESQLVRDNPWIGTLAALNPIAILFEAYRSVIYGTPLGRPEVPDFAALAGLLIASVILLAGTTVFFKRLEPTFAKVL